MKLLMVTSIKEYENEICKLFKTSKIESYSTYDIEGHKIHKPKNIQDNWFSSHRDTFDSKMFFTFCSEKLINNLLEEIKEFNLEKADTNPVKAIVMNIENNI